MKNYGKVVKYNGLYGNIKGVDGIDYVLLDKNLITRDICENAKTKVLETLDGPDFFCYCEEERKEESHGYTQNSC